MSLSDVLPTSVTYVAGSLTNSSGTAATSSGVSGSTATLTFASLALGSSSVYTLQATVNGTVQPYQTWTDTAQATWASIPGNITTAQSTYSAVSTQRDGTTTDPGGTANNLAAAKTATFSTAKPTIATTILATDLGSTTGNNLAIGETVQYQTTVTISNGVSPSAVLTLTLPSGLAVVGLDSIAATGSLSTSYSGGFAAALSAATSPIPAPSTRPPRRSPSTGRRWPST